MYVTRNQKEIANEKSEKKVKHTVTVSANTIPSIYRIFYRYVWFIKCFGFAPFSIHGHITNGTVYVTGYDIILFVVFMAIQSAAFCVELLWQNRQTQLAIVDIANRFVMLTTILIGIVTISFNFWRRHSIWRILERCNDFDKTIHLLGITSIRRLPAFKLHLVYTVTVLFIIKLPLNILYWDGQLMNWEYYALRSLANFNYCSLLGIYIAFTAELYIRFRTLTTAFRMNFLAQPTSDGQTANILFVKRGDNVAALDLIAVLYDKLNDAVTLVNYCFGFQIMLAVGLSFVFSLFSIFSGYRVLAQSDYKAFGVTLTNFIWSTFFASYIVAIVILGSTINGQAKQLIGVCYKARNANKSIELNEKMQMLTEQIVNRMPTLSCGLFTIDWSLLASIGTAYATYFIILIQFENSSK